MPALLPQFPQHPHVPRIGGMQLESVAQVSWAKACSQVWVSLPRPPGWLSVPRSPGWLEREGRAGGEACAGAGVMSGLQLCVWGLEPAATPTGVSEDPTGNGGRSRVAGFRSRGILETDERLCVPTA